jgi:hypothetical protein
MAQNSVDISTALGSGSSGIAAGVVNKTIDFSSPSTTFDKSGNYSSNWSTYNSNVSFTAACSAIADAQQRLFNILTNPNYPALVSSTGLSNSIDQYTLVFNLLYYANVSSSFDVAAYVPSQFVADYSSYFVNSAATITSSQSSLLADEYCNSAANVRSQVILTYMAVSDANGSQYRNTTWSNYSSAADSNFSNLPTYQTLFNNQEYISVPEFQSVLSPASYLVDLHKCEQSYVVKSDSVSNLITFAYRRPDIASIVLNDEDNTDTEVSQLSIGVNLLALQLYAQLNNVDVTQVASTAPDYATDVQNSLSTMVYPFSTPFNYSLEKTRSVFNLSSTSLASIWNTYYPSSIYPTTQDYQTAVNRETLEISQEQLTLLSTPVTSGNINQSTINSRYGINTSQDITKIATFENQTGLSGSQVEDLLYGDLSDSEISGSVIGNTFYINGAGSTPMTIDPSSQTLQNANANRVDRMNRFIRLSQITGYAFNDLNSFLYYVRACEDTTADLMSNTNMSTSLEDYLVRFQSITSAYSNLSVDACIGLVGLLRNYGQENGPTFIAQVFGSIAPGYGDTNTTSWTPSDTADSANLTITYQIMNGLGVSQSDLSTLSSYVAQQFGKTANDSITLTQDFLSALYRVAISARLFGLSVSNMLFLLDGLDSSYCQFAGPLTSASSAVTTKMLEVFAAVKSYASTLSGAGLSIADAAFMANNATYQNAQSVPGLNATLTLLNDVANGVSGTLLTESVFSTWLIGQESGFLNYPDDVSAIYAAFTTQNVLDDQGVVLASSVSAATATTCFDAATGLVITVSDDLLASLNSLIATYQEQQESAINGVLGNTLGLSTDVELTVSSWGTLLMPASTTPGMNNVLHILYSMTQDTLAADSSTINDLSAADVVTQMELYAALARFAVLPNTLGLSQQEVEFVVAGSASLVQPPASGEFSISPSGVEQVISLHSLVTSYADSDNNLLTYLSGSGDVSNLSTATSWSQDNINTLLTAWATSPTNTPVTISDNIALVTALQSCMTINSETGLSVSALLSMCSYTTTTGNAAYATLAAQVEQALYAANPNTDESTILTTMNITLNEAYRDVLVDALISQFSQSTDSVLASIQNSNSLTEYLLFDVEVGGKFVNSYVEEATNAYQMFFYRIIMQVEPYLSFSSSTFPDTLWPWFRNYRVWEANREVFITPENYLEPDLRSNASEIFVDFTNNLQVGAITDDVIDTAFNNYLDDFGTLANLQIAASNFTQIDSTSGSIALIGQTNTSPSVYYYRTGDISIDSSTGAYTPTGWTAWSQITTSIPSDFIHTIYAYNRLFIFWAEFGNSDSSSNSDSQTYQATIKYCFYTLSGGWSAAQTVGTVDVGDNLGSYSAYLSDANCNQFILTYSETIDITYECNDGTQEVKAMWSLSETLVVTAQTNDYNEFVISGETSNSVTLSSGQPLSSVYVSAADSLFPSDGAYAFSGTSSYMQFQVDQVGLTNLNSGNATAISVGMWVKVVDWGSNGLKDHPHAQAAMLSVKINTSNAGDNSPDLNLLLTPTGLALQGQASGDPIDTGEDDVWVTSNAFSSAITTDQWVFVAFSIEVTGTNTQSFAGVSWTYQICNVNFYACALQNNTVVDLLASSTTTSSSNAINVQINAADYMRFGGVIGLGNEGYNYSSYVCTGQSVELQNIVVADQALSLDQLSSLSGAGSTGTSLVTSVPFDAVPNGTVSEYVPNSSSRLYIMDTGDAEYLALPLESDCSTWRYVRLTSNNTGSTFASVFLTDGISQLLDTSTQLTAETSFSALSPQVASVPREYWPVDDHIDMGGANSIYYWELFLFAPWLVAKTYHNVAAYDSAQDWYQYVFDPTKQLNSISATEQAELQSDNNPNDLYWRFVGLRSYENALLQCELDAASQEETVEDLMDNPLEYEAGPSGSTFVVSSTVSQALSDYYDDPFDPHAIAMLRPIAYQKAVVMHYVQNLLDWGDALYTECTRETIVEASLLYLQANDLLGEQPADVGDFDEGTTAVTLDTIDTTYGSGSAIPEFLVGLEGSLTPIATAITLTADASVPYNFIPGLNFGIPENSQLLSFWSLVSSRLSNIRNYLDINGNPLDLALFSPAINAMSLVSAAAGSSLSSALSYTQNTQIPNYRFSSLLGLAKEYTSTLIQFGEKLQGILERKDAEALAQLQVSQQGTVLEMLVASKEAQINAAQENLSALQQAMVSALTRYAYYSGLVSLNRPSTSTKSNNLTSTDMANSSFTSASVQTQSDTTTNASASVSMVNSTLATTAEGVGTTLDLGAVTMLALGANAKLNEAPEWAIPTIFGAAWGGAEVPAMARAASEYLTSVGWTMNMAGSLVNEAAGYLRRTQEWQVQSQLAQADISQIQAQYTAATYQLQIAQQDYDLLQTQISQNQVIANFYTSKFTSEALYQWMSGQLTSTYSQAYRLALSTALTAQFALEYEKGLAIGSLGMINTSSWNSNYKGLMSGEPLLQSINQLERYYIDNNVRRFEIVKTISLQNLLANNSSYQPLATQLAANNGGTVQFSLDESLFDQDYPGHYCRQIKAVTISIPAVLGPYQDIHATLTQTANTVVISPDMAAITYLNQGASTVPTSIRANFGVNQAVAISGGYNDSGLFVMNFDDPRYLPFEGTGAVSDWTLYISDLDTTLNPTTTLSISDIIVTVRYTALSGGSSFANSVRSSLNSTTTATATT